MFREISTSNFEWDIEPGIGNCDSEGEFNIQVNLDGKDGSGKKVEISQIRGTLRSHVRGVYTKDTEGPKLSIIIKEMQKNILNPEKQVNKIQVACFDELSLISQCQFKFKDKVYGINCNNSKKVCSGLIDIMGPLEDQFEVEVFGKDLVNNENHQKETLRSK